MPSPHQETVEKARARVLEMLSDPGMMGGDGIGVEEVDALIAAVREEADERHALESMDELPA